MFNFILPTEFFFGFGCVETYGSAISAMGKRAFIVTGGNGAKSSGALGDVTALLDTLCIERIVFDKVEQNPSVATCFSGAKAALAFRADFIIAVGGGSAIDAAKAVAVIAANGLESYEQLFQSFEKAPLPLVAVPTTAGTGSEGNGIAVLTDGTAKRSIKDTRCFPRFSFADPKYLRTLPAHLAMSCALDALCHTVESYLSPKSSTSVTEMLALDGLTKLWGAINALSKGNPDDEALSSLSLGATLGGIVIQFTGTSLPHPMGYNLTLFKGVHHGAATAAFLPYYLDKCMNALPAKMAEMTDRLSLLPNEVGSFVRSVNSLDISVSESEAREFAAKIAGASQFRNIPFDFTQSDIEKLYLSLFS